MSGEFLNRVDIHQVEVPGHGPVGLPLRCYDMTAAGAIFMASAARIRELLPSQRLRPVGIPSGKASIILAAIEYRRLADIEPYREFAALIPVRCGGEGLPGGAWGRIGAYAAFLPVTSEASRVVGMSVWGYPKSTGQIDYADDGTAIRVSLRLDGHESLALSVAKMRARQVRAASYSFTVKDHKLVRTRIEIRGKIGASFGGKNVSLNLGGHPMARALARLEMNENALAGFFVPEMQALIYPPGLWMGL